MIYGIGIDIVKIERMREAHEKWGVRFFEKILTDDEIAYCFHKSVPYPSLAVRFAAKEALIKAIGSEVPVNMKSIEVVNDDRGKPVMKVSGQVADFFRDKGISSCHLSLSHEREYGVANVVLER